VTAAEAALAPTLGPQVCHFLNTFGVHGPGDLIGQRYQLSFEEMGFLFRAYELVADAYRPGRWRRRYRHGIYCRRKGLRKSELMANVALLEFDGPCRFSGRWAQGGEVDEWGYTFSPGEPIGERVRSPEIPVVATTEEQAERLVWGVMRFVFLNTPLASRYRVQEDQIFLAGQPKEAAWCYLVPPTNSRAADGAKPTFIPREEAHLWTSADLRETAETMDRNAIKRQAADPWTMDATTMYAPGEESVLELSLQAIDAGDTSILFDHLAAADHWDLDDDDQWLAAVREASGDAWEWTNVAGMRSLFLSPKTSRASFERYQLNRAVAVEHKPFSGERFDLFADPKRTPGPSKRVPLVVFLDGAITRDSTALIAWTVEDRPHLFLAGLWERPDATLREEWHVPKAEVTAMVDALEEEFTVVLLAGDSDRFWSPQLTAWEEQYGTERVVHFPTRHGRLMGTAIDRFEEEWRVGLARAAEGGQTPWTHEGSAKLRRHFAATVVAKRGSSPYRILAKASEGLADKIDASVAAVSGFALIPDARVKAAELMKPKRAGVY
jgi:hypothetical protein